MYFYLRAVLVFSACAARWPVTKSIRKLLVVVGPPLLCRTFLALQVPQRIAAVVQGALHERPPLRALGPDLLPLLGANQD